MLVELKARFDEESNILWATQLEDAGVHVVYGVVGLKTHAKITLVVRQDADGIRCYAHIGTGNYHAATARLYTDFGLLTCDADLGADLVRAVPLPHRLREARSYRKLLVAPVNMRKRFLEMIRRGDRARELGQPAPGSSPR